MAHFVRKKSDDALAIELATGKSLREAARTVGIAERTARRRADHPKFRRNVSEVRDRMLGEAVGLLAHATSSAVTALVDLLKSAAENVRLNAARTILDRVVGLRDSVELAERIAKLEASLEGGAHGPAGPGTAS